MLSRIIYLTILLHVEVAHPAKILAIVAVPSYSHQVAFYPLWTELSRRGHEITLLTTDPLKDPSLTNLTEIDLSFSYEIIKSYNFSSIINEDGGNPIRFVLRVVEMFSEVIDQELSSPKVKELVDGRNVEFDVLMVETFFPTMIAFGHKFKCPVVGITSMDAHAIVHESMGNPVHPALYPDVIVPFIGKFTFVERVLSAAIMGFVKLFLEIYALPEQQLIVRRHFGEGYPKISEMLKNMSLVFMTADHVFHPIRPTGPNTIYIGGGSHLKSPKKLPKDLKNFLDSAKNGVIYFSLGSNIKSKDIPENTRKIIIETFAELPYSILWKFEADDLAGKPDNVKIMKWLPQQDLLRHPNVKLFITQGGLQSMEEAIFTHVPIVGMPFFGDQISNVKKMVFKGLGLSVDRKSLDKDTFKSAILEVITNPKYRERVKELADLAQDEPMTGLERAVWWTEYVIRHKGASHLKSPAVDMPFYQYFLLDVIGFLLLLVTTVLYILTKLFKFVFKLLCSPFANKKVKTN